MFTTLELLSLIQREHHRAGERSRLARIADCARKCCRASANLLDRMLRARRPAPTGC